MKMEGKTEEDKNGKEETNLEKLVKELNSEEKKIRRSS